MSSFKKTIIEAAIAFIIAKRGRPYIHVVVDDRCTIPSFLDSYRTAFNISPSAVINYKATDTEISFTARFQGVSADIVVPYDCICMVSNHDDSSMRVLIPYPADVTLPGHKDGSAVIGRQHLVPSVAPDKSDKPDESSAEIIPFPKPRK